ncbi:MAG: hypothetical protein ACPLX7_08775 [Candidatus Kapaibacteriota bacterium]|jgi:TM2 domain-containing membrane protein YozV
MKKFLIIICLVVIPSYSSVPQYIDSSKIIIIPSEKNPALAFLCSLIFPGLGQMYNEEVGKGFTILALTTIGPILLASDLGKKNDQSIKNLFIAYTIGVYIYSLIDAPIRAKSITDEARFKKALLQSRGFIGFLPIKNFNIYPYCKTNNLGITVELKF